MKNKKEIESLLKLDSKQLQIVDMQVKKKSTFIAYLLFLIPPFGFLGMHLLYLGKKRGFLYALLNSMAFAVSSSIAQNNIDFANQKTIIAVACLWLTLSMAIYDFCTLATQNEKLYQNKRNELIEQLNKDAA
jgi:TM2 domain-containing membrane protein YozV